MVVEAPQEAISTLQIISALETPDGNNLQIVLQSPTQQIDLFISLSEKVVSGRRLIRWDGFAGSGLFQISQVSIISYEDKNGDFT